MNLEPVMEGAGLPEEKHEFETEREEVVWRLQREERLAHTKHDMLQEFIGIHNIPVNLMNRDDEGRISSFSLQSVALLSYDFGILDFDEVFRG